MKTFELVLTRYADGRREISDVEHMQADNFADAYNRASLICRFSGMADGKEYDIVSIHAPGYHGHKCKSQGKGIWQRDEIIDAK